MHWTIVLLLISLIINGILFYVIRNSHWSYGKRETFKLPLILWILIGISTIIPVVNTVTTIIYIIATWMSYANCDLETNDDFWLTKEY